jgi:hypothetical protein
VFGGPLRGLVVTGSDSGIVICDTHGRRPYGMICVHLRQNEGLRYFAVPRCKHGPPQAWCEACNAVVDQESGWTDVSDAHADWHLFCTECYAGRLRSHRFVEYVQGPDDDCDWTALGLPYAPSALLGET